MYLSWQARIDAYTVNASRALVPAAVVAAGEVAGAWVLDTSVFGAGLVGHTALCVVGAGTCNRAFSVVDENTGASEEARSGWWRRVALRVCIPGTIYRCRYQSSQLGDS
jgi:hypothetical protein